MRMMVLSLVYEKELSDISAACIKKNVEINYSILILSIFTVWPLRYYSFKMTKLCFLFRNKTITEFFKPVLNQGKYMFFKWKLFICVLIIEMCSYSPISFQI